MSRDDPQVRLRHMLEYAREAISLMHNRTRADLDTDRALGLAIIRCVEIVGEAASRVPEPVQQSPWPEIIGMRNRLVHGYDLVDYEIVWSTIKEDLPALVSELEKIV
jgi:uncharacterized protein with HEPN domain